MNSKLEIERNVLRAGLILIALACFGAAQARAGQDAANADHSSGVPQFVSAKVIQQTASRSLAEEMKAWSSSATEAQWLGYAVPAENGERIMCCGDWNGSCGPCQLEDGNHGNSYTSGKSTVSLEGPRFVVVLYRAENKKIGKISVISAECAVDACGLQITWLPHVRPAESVAYLRSYVADSAAAARDSDRLNDSAIAAIAMHGDPAADGALQAFIAPSQPERLRKRAAFWLGEARGASGERVLEKMAKDDPSPDVRADVAFALTLSKEPRALDAIIRMAHDDTSSHVRGQALFWLAQKAGERAVQTIKGAIQNDPDTEVKKKAVFALSQLPKGEGVPKLIEVARTNRNPQVRKQAMFWLGQSGDPRALAFFEKILAR